MEELSDRDLNRVRLRFLDLIKSFFAGEPDAEKMSRWRGTFSALSKEQISPRFDSAVREIGEMLGTRSLQQLQEEYYELFTNPFDGDMVETNASYYLSGRNYGQVLADVRGFMNEVGLKRADSVNDPEDSLVVLLDTFIALVEQEKDEAQEELSRQLQARMIKEFLDPFAVKFMAALQQSSRAGFYTLCSKVLNGYLDLEKGLIGVQ